MFDFDGVICDTEWPEFESCRRAWAAVDLQLTVDDWHAAVGHHSFDWEGQLAARLGREVPSEARAVRHEVWRELVHSVPVLDGVVELLASELPCAVVSNSSVAWVDGHLRRLGLRARFASVHCRDTVARVKPAPDGYLAACRALGAEPREAIAFEDSSIGVAAAKAAGLFTVAVPHALTSAHDLSSADLVVGSLAEVDLAALNLSSRS